MEPIDYDSWYSAADAARYLGVKKSSVVRYCRDGKIRDDLCDKRGPTKMWYVKGGGIQQIRELWNLEPLPEKTRD